MIKCVVPISGGKDSQACLKLALKEFKPDEIALSDTIGVAVPKQVKQTLEMARRYFPVEKTALHFHNTYGTALSCLQEGYENGIRLFDGSTGGVGGCPYAKGATGNVATEDVLYAFYRQGFCNSFPAEEVKGSFKILKNEFKVKCHSRLFDIWDKGGGWHGIE
jgi:hydroxymethylglutaryl-CoA lyase